MTDQAKPRALFFAKRIMPIDKEGRKTPDNRFFLEQHYINWISHFFDTVVIDDDCDYGELVDTHKPDICIFQSVLCITHRQYHISNLDADKSVPRVLFTWTDAWARMAPVVLQDMATFEAQAVFWSETTAKDFFPDLKEKLIIVPHFLSGDIYRDYGEEKTVGLSFFSHMQERRPFEMNLLEAAKNTVSCFIGAHACYGDNPKALMLEGEAYARAINRSYFAVGAQQLFGTMVKKMIEVPACRTALVSPDQPILRHLGYKDMENAILGPPEDAVDKMVSLLRNEEKLSALIDAGHRFVHDNHRLENRTQLIDWFRLYQQKKAGKKIVQTHYMEPLVLMPSNEQEPDLTSPQDRLPLFQQALKDAQDLLKEEKHQEAYDAISTAEKAYFDKDARLLGELVRFALRTGNLQMAQNLLKHLLGYRKHFAHALHWGTAAADENRREPKDPVEACWQIMVAICAGLKEEPISWFDEFFSDPALRHPALIRCARFVEALFPETKIDIPPEEEEQKSFTVHVNPHHPEYLCKDDFCLALFLSGKQEMAEKLLKARI